MPVSTPEPIPAPPPIKPLIRWAYRHHYTTQHDFDAYNPKLKKLQPTIVFLTKNELDRLRGYQIPAHKQYLERVRDVYLFCCDSSTIDVPPVALTNVPPVALTNVPPVALTNVPPVALTNVPPVAQTNVPPR